MSELKQCGHCGMYHGSGTCPRVKAIEYYENGTVKRVEYHRDEPAVAPLGIHFYPGHNPTLPAK